MSFIRNVQTVSPVTALSAKTVAPELTYMTPSITSGVTCVMLLAAPASNDQARSRSPTFPALMSSSSAYRLPPMSRLCSAQFDCPSPVSTGADDARVVVASSWAPAGAAGNPATTTTAAAASAAAPVPA